MSDLVLVERASEPGIALLTLNRPEVLNALSTALIERLDMALSEVAANPAVRAVVLTGAGGRAFCAGMDLKEFFTALKDQPAEYDRISRLATEWRSRTLK